MHTVLECKSIDDVFNANQQTQTYTQTMITDHTGQIGRHMYHISHLFQQRLCTCMYKGVHKIAGS